MTQKQLEKGSIWEKADTNGDGLINATDVSNILDMSTNLNNNTGVVNLRNSTESDPFTNKTISVSAGNDLSLNAFLVGDLDGSYANVLASS